MKGYICPHCGQKVYTDDGKESVRCPFCKEEFKPADAQEIEDVSAPPMQEKQKGLFKKQNQNANDEDSEQKEAKPMSKNAISTSCTLFRCSMSFSYALPIVERKG